jgi:secreted trypsin-like serine protease
MIRKIAVLVFVLGITMTSSAAAHTGGKRIVGGAPAAADTAPWTVALVAHGYAPPDGQFCGGTLVSPTAVVTAAHCVVDTPDAGAVDVLSGRTTLSGAGGQRIQASSIDVHPDYFSDDGVGHDVAVVHLASPAGAPAIGFAGPAQAGLAAAGAHLLLSGWGLTTNAEDSTPDQLQMAPIVVTPNRACRADYGSEFDGALMICSLGGLPDACNGDSGGPLVSLDGPAPTLVGIVSFGGQQCGDPGYPGVYTRVSAEGAWIAERVGAAPAAGTGGPSADPGRYTVVSRTRGPVRDLERRRRR